MTKEEFETTIENNNAEISALNEEIDRLEESRSKLSSIAYDDICLFTAGWSGQLTNIDDSIKYEGSNEMKYVETMDIEVFSFIDSYQAAIVDMMDQIDSKISDIQKRIDEISAESQSMLHEAIWGE